MFYYIEFPPANLSQFSSFIEKGSASDEGFFCLPALGDIVNGQEHGFRKCLLPLDPLGIQQKDSTTHFRKVMLDFVVLQLLPLSDNLEKEVSELGDDPPFATENCDQI